MAENVTFKELLGYTQELAEYQRQFPFVARLGLNAAIGRFRKNNEAAISKLNTAVRGLYEKYVTRDGDNFSVGEDGQLIFISKESEIDFKAEWDKLMTTPCEIKI